MIYEQLEPREELKNWVHNFWWVDGENDAQPSEEKIIPDGYIELIFHYKAPFESNLGGTWKVQSANLLAGQISNCFHLRNTGLKGMFGIKLQPWTLYTLFNSTMKPITNTVVPLPHWLSTPLFPLLEKVAEGSSFSSFVATAESLLLPMVQNKALSPFALATKSILHQNGIVHTQTLASQTGVSIKTLERNFNALIGLTPKLYARIIRLSHTFKLVQNKNNNWSDIAFLAGYYDQPHFIKEFRAFTGEEPSKYGFDEQNMANFFLKK